MTDTGSQSAETSRRSLAGRWRRELYLTRLEWNLEGVTTGKERRGIVGELRQALATDPRGTAAALCDLGAPRSLAQQYSENRVGRPFWSLGAITAGAALLVYWTVFLAFTFGMLAAVESTGQAEAHGRFLFVDVLAFSGPDGIGIGWTSEWAWLVVPAVIALAAFLLGARIWRLGSAHRP